MDTGVSSCVSPARNNGSDDDKNPCKLRLFGFELNLVKPCKSDNKIIKQKTSHDDESTANSSSSSTVSSGKQQKESIVATTQVVESKKLECQYCFKRFGNSQALGGHQNAHKKERMKKKKLQLQARKASINYYLLQQQQQQHPSFSTPHEFSVSDESSRSQFSFTSYVHHDLNIINGHHNLYEGYGYGSPYNQQNPCKFTLTHVERSSEERKASINASQLPNSKQSNRYIDLQLGL